MSNTPEKQTYSNIRRARRCVATAMIALIGFASFGCYGRFPITHAVYDINGNLSSNKIVQSILFWIFILLPVYSIAMFIDAIFFNLIEFWTGETILSQTIEQDDGTRIVLAPGALDDEAVLTIVGPGGETTTATFVRISPERMDVRTAEGDLAGIMLRRADGSIDLCDADGRAVETLPSSGLEAFLAAHRMKPTNASVM